jgi:hypothetical protein
MISRISVLLISGIIWFNLVSETEKVNFILHGDTRELKLEV